MSILRNVGLTNRKQNSISSIDNIYNVTSNGLVEEAKYAADS